MTRISQLLAVVRGVQDDTLKQLTELQRLIATPDLVSGLEKTYRPAREAVPGEPLPLQRPGQAKHVVVTVDEVLGKAAVLLTRQFDVARTLDEAKTRASADVIVDGQVVLTQVTTDHLFWLEGRLADLLAFIAGLPVLDAAEQWTDEGTEPGQRKTRPVETTSNDKVYFNHVLAEATPQHPAQVQVMHRDEVVGFWTTVKFSGAMDPRRKRQLTDRVTRLREAVKFAREEANTTEVTDVREGARIFDWLLA